MDDEQAKDPGRPDDPYSRSQYRKLIAWETRIGREAPFLTRCLAEVPDASVLDLGCGSGEHVAWFAQGGARAVGLDQSDAMIESARAHEARGEGRFFLGDALHAKTALGAEPPFGLALCLGNMLPHLTEDEDLAAFAAAVRSVLVPGGRLLIQLLNYTALLKDGSKALPVNVRPGDGDEQIVFVRVMKSAPGGRVLFFPTTLTLDPSLEEPMAVHTTRRVELRAWSAAQLTAALEKEQFRVRLFGDMRGGDYKAAASHDLVVLAEARAHDNERTVP